MEDPRKGKFEAWIGGKAKEHNLETGGKVHRYNSKPMPSQHTLPNPASPKSEVKVEEASENHENNESDHSVYCCSSFNISARHHSSGNSACQGFEQNS